MIQDAWIVGRHELRGIRISLLPTAGSILTFGLVLVLFGLVVPVGLSGGWLNTTGYLVLWLWLVWLLIAGPISDSFAGESERHTLDALFATRLPDVAILAGKTSAVACYATVLALLAIGASAAIARVPGTGWPFGALRWTHLIAAVLLTPLAALLASSAGALISLSARSARQAHQAIIAVVPVAVLAALAAGRLMQAVAPDTVGRLSQRLPTVLVTPLAGLAAALLMALFTAILWALAVVRLHSRRVIS